MNESMKMKRYDFQCSLCGGETAMYALLGFSQFVYGLLASAKEDAGAEAFFALHDVAEVLESAGVALYWSMEPNEDWCYVEREMQERARSRMTELYRELGFAQNK